MEEPQTKSQHDTPEVVITSLHQNLATHLTQALEADDTATKNYHIRSAHQFLIVMESSARDTESPPSDW